MNIIQYRAPIAVDFNENHPIQAPIAVAFDVNPKMPKLPHFGVDNTLKIKLKLSNFLFFIIFNVNHYFNFIS